MSSLLAATVVDAAALADELARFRVIEPDRLTELLANFSGGGPSALAEYLVRRGILTTFQAERALAGECRSLVLGPYRITGPGGPGTFGPLLAASHRDKPGEFRIRVLPLRSLWRARQAKQLTRLLANCRHAAVAPLIDADSANGLHYLAWPQAEGELLADRVAAKGPLSAGDVIGLLAHLAEALHDCHGRQVAHGALTPRSVLLDRNGLPRLSELGAGAILTASLTDDESLLDTLSRSTAATEIVKFAAPEYISEATASPTADQYSLGAIGYFALTGAPPFAASSLSDQLAAQSAGPPSTLAAIGSVPTDLIDIIDRMLQVDPSKRFAGLDEVHGRLAGIALQPAVQGARSEPLVPGSLFTTFQPAKPGSGAHPLAGSGLVYLPTRDDSEASITFELPPPEIEPPAAARRIEPPPAETPSQRYRDTQTSSRDETHRQRPVAATGRFAARPEGSAGKTTSAASPEANAPNQPPGSTPDSPNPFSGSSGKLKSVAKPGQDPRTGVHTPVLYHTETEPADEASVSGEQPIADSILWKKVKRNLLFWQASADMIQVSIFGPATVSPGQPAKLSVYLHTPQTAESVRTLSRAFHHDAELIGSGYVAQEVTRETELAMHLSVANAGVSQSLHTMVWRGQPHRQVFDLHVPWESPGGAAPGLISIGRSNIRIGKIEFRLRILPRKG